jgi:hypothetical protein
VRTLTLTAALILLRPVYLATAEGILAVSLIVGLALAVATWKVAACSQG